MTVKLPEKLWKTTLVIWSDSPPGAQSLEDLGREAEVGDAYCSVRVTDYVDPRKDEQFDDTEFFGVDGEGDDEPAD